MPTVWDAVIVGGGAAGFFAAVACAEQAIQAGDAPPRMLILEKARRPLGKVLISGGGRCNVTHACFDPAQLVAHYPRGGAALRGALARFQPADTIAWFEQRGVPLKTEADGRVFPVSDSALSIANCLQTAAAQAGVTVWTQTAAQAIEIVSAETYPLHSFRVQLRRGGLEACAETLLTRRVLLATGGDRGGMALAANLGHTIVPPVPSLFTFKVPDARLDGLAGISVTEASLRLADPENLKPAIPVQHGALLITHWGLSGPAVLRLSAWGARWLYTHNYRAEMIVNWLYPLTPEQTWATLSHHKTTPECRRKLARTHCPFSQIPLRLWQRLVEAVGIRDAHRWADLSKDQLRRLAEELTAGRYTIQGKSPFKDEFVTCGGVALDEVDFKTMQSRCVPGLYFAGEILDIDGLTGGFNFQSACTTGSLFR
jgi:hypothetical protein